MCELGTGDIDFKPVIGAAAGWGVKYLTAEQDHSWIDNDPIKSGKISFDVHKAMIG